MTPPKEPSTFKYPRLYWRETFTDELQRLRIIYPNGTAEWGGGFTIDSSQWLIIPPCWGRYSDDWIPTNGFEAVEMMKKYDAHVGFETTFLGEIK